MTVIGKEIKIIKAHVKHENMQSVRGSQDCYIDYLIESSKMTQAIISIIAQNCIQSSCHSFLSKLGNSLRVSLALI